MPAIRLDPEVRLQLLAAKVSPSTIDLVDEIAEREGHGQRSRVIRRLLEDALAREQDQLSA